MTLSVYIAGAYSERARIERAMNAIQTEDDITLTHNWIAVIDEVVQGDQTKEADLTPSEREKYANNDLSHALGADVFWFLVPEKGGRGCWFEAGFVQAVHLSGHRITIASGPHVGVTVFTELMDYKFADDQEAFDFIRDRGWV